MMAGPPTDLPSLLSDLGCVVFERGWLSSNNVLFCAPGAQTSLVDTGYATHSAQTLRLVENRLEGRSLERIVNTHLHSDHCGGNARLQEVFGSEILVPAVSVDVVRAWDEDRLTYTSTGQSCDRFPAHGALRYGDSIRLGHRDWQIIAAPGHDPSAVMLFEPDSRTLIAGDALWENRLAIIFPELVGESGFAEAGDVLDTIEALSPAWVIPGHGAPFRDAGTAVAVSRSRLSQFRERPARHVAHAFRALVMFRLLEIRSCEEEGLRDWFEHCPLFVQARQAGNQAALTAKSVVDSLVESGVVIRTAGVVSVVDR